MLRKIITANKLYFTIPIPKEYLHRKLEILILPFEEYNNDGIEYWTEEELQQMSMNPSFSFDDDNEDYSKW
jgi:hypothetical protein